MDIKTTLLYYFRCKNIVITMTSGRPGGRKVRCEWLKACQPPASLEAFSFQKSRRQGYVLLACIFVFLLNVLSFFAMCTDDLCWVQLYYGYQLVSLIAQFPFWASGSSCYASVGILLDVSGSLISWSVVLQLLLLYFCSVLADPV